ncbi:unnamed protein product [Diabrotica balteata]|uniref:Uncharacterized protein n=1 Tax=Diabrotica balteata TaxID=107213 RepID=A0A9N9TC43_DIABA|nr:unnamed protein product [Diabrotica balteata]
MTGWTGSSEIRFSLGGVVFCLILARKTEAKSINMAAFYGYLLVLEVLERIDIRRSQRRIRRMLRDTQNPFSLSDAQFRQ